MGGEPAEFFDGLADRLIAWARWHFRRRAQVAGAALSDHMAVVARRLGLRDQPPDFPDVLLHVWDAFLRLHRARASSGFGPLPIAYTEIAAFFSVIDMPLSPWEAECLRALDDAYLAVQAESASAEPTARESNHG